MMVSRCTAVQWAIPGLIGVWLLACPAHARYSGGTGEPNDPYQIATCADLIALGGTPGDYDKHVILTTDIDLDPNLPGGTVFDRGVVAPASAIDVSPWTIGTAFMGVFDGSGHTISHLTITGPEYPVSTGAEYLGLFGWLGSGAEVRNLGLIDVRISGCSKCAGGLVALNDSGTIAHSYSKGTFTCHNGFGVGGLVGMNYGAVTDSYSEGTINWMYDLIHNGDWIGGLVGINGQTGVITHSHSMCKVQGDHGIGGLVGTNSGTIAKSYSTGEIAAMNTAGGLVAANNGTVSQCYSTSLVSADFAGGLVGENPWGTITNSYSEGAVQGTILAGGLVCRNWTAVSRCYSIGAVHGMTTGGLITPGNPWQQVTGCFWDMGTSDEIFSGGGTGKSTAAMQMGSTFLKAGWDFLNETANGVEDIWWILEGNDYPRLTWEEGPARVRLPRDAEMDAPRSPILRWAPGELGRGHDVYFGDDAVAVANATVETPDIYRGRQVAENVAYDPGVLEWGKTYYWRIDEVSQIDRQSIVKGHVWSFTVTDFVATGAVVDDFEGYTPATGRALSETWVPRAGTSAYPMIEQLNVHSGRQCMAMDYRNLGGAGWYSEVQRLWEVPQDWTMNNADTLTLYFHGWTGNGLDPLYVAIEDSGSRVGMVVHPDAGAVWAMEWQKWHVALGGLQAAGVDVAAVKKLVIGVGDRADPKPGGTGRIYIDDIRLTNRMP